jgi:hypothetical protein
MTPSERVENLFNKLLDLRCIIPTELKDEIKTVPVGAIPRAWIIKAISEAEREAHDAGVIEGMERAAEICHKLSHYNVCKESEHDDCWCDECGSFIGDREFIIQELRSEIEKMKGSK